MQKRHFSYFLTLLIFIFIPLLSFQKELPQKTFTVVIDPGHGGKDPGAVIKQIWEKNIVLAIGLKLGDYITQNLPNVKVIYTRDRDVFIPLYKRAEIANKNKADLFISIHANYCGTPSVSGTETFVLGEHVSDENNEIVRKENEAILLEDDYSTNYAGYDPNNTESNIMFATIQNEYWEQSINFAASIQDQFRVRAGRKDRSVKQAGFLVLWRTSMPSVLVEAGFLSNPSEAKYLNTKDGQAILASAMYRAVRDYKSKIEARSNYKISSNSDEGVTNIQEAKQVEKAVSKKTEIYFSIQLAASSKKLDLTATNFHKLKPIFRKKENSNYKYYLGKEATYEKISKYKRKAKKYYPDAFIVAFENENQIPVKKALAKTR